MSSQKPVLISGAGLASLLLAQSLKRSNIPFRIFEREASFAGRGQGYRLRLSAEGLDAIESVLDGPPFQTFWDKCGKTAGAGFTAYDAVSGDETEHRTTESLSSRDGKIVGIARGDMRTAFAQGCEEYIEWSKQVIGYELTSSGVRAVFADGSQSIEGSLLVAGDGIRSKVSQQVSNGALKIYDTGASGIHGQAPTTAFKGLGEGVFRLRDTSRGPGHYLFLITNVRPGDMDDPNIQFGWTMGGEPGAIRVPRDDYTIVGQTAANLAKELAKDWHPRFKPLFDNMAEEEAAFWKITCSTPSGVPEWPNEPRVTVIGDAAHSMTPAGGIGANTAVRDSALLGGLLRDAGGNEPGLTAKYEKEMRVYASEAVHTSYSTAVAQFGIDIDEMQTVAV